jgi:elongation factor G
MKDYLANDIRNVVLLGHSGVGKSTLIESALFYTKAIDRMGNTLDGTSTVDYDPEEVKRGLSVFTALAPVEWKNCKINFIDTPGYLDYEGEKAAGFAVGDNALIVLSAKEGIEAGTETAYKAANKRKMPTIFFINKIDDENADFDKVCADLRNQFGKTVIPFELPIMESGKLIGSINILRKKAWYYNDLSKAEEVPADYKDRVEEYYAELAEALASSDDALMEKFFEGEEFSEEEIAKGLRIGVRSGEIKPVYCGSAIEVKGIQRLLDLITEYFPCYAEIGTIKAGDVELETNEHEAFSALVYKTIVDPFVGKISYLKVMSGVLGSDSQVYNPKKDQNEKISQIFVVKGKNQMAVGKLFTGDLGAVTKLQYTETNDTLCTKEKKVQFDDIVFPRPMLGVAISPKTKDDEDKMSEAIKRILEEDKSLQLVKNIETGEQVLYAVGDQQIDVVVNKLKSKYKVEINMKEPKVQYRETIKKKVEAEGKHKKQSGGAGQFGQVSIRFEPCDSEDMIFETDIFGGSVSKEFFPPTELGLRKCMEHGELAGYKVVGVKATLFDGKMHPVDSKAVAFEAAARLAFKAAMPQANPILLEPIGKATVICPEKYTGDIVGDFNKRRGMIMDIGTNEDGEGKIEAEVPMSEMQKYATELRSMTQGRGSYVIDFDRYEPAPQNITDKVVREAQAEKKDED